MIVSQKEITSLGYRTLNQIKQAKNDGTGDVMMAFCSQTSTLYRYLTNGPMLIPNDTSVLITGDGGATRWVGIGGVYNLTYTNYITGQYAYVSPDIDFSSSVTYISGGGSISSIDTAKCVFYKTSNNVWWMEGVLKLTASSASRTALIVNVAGVLPDGNGTTYWQNGAADTNGGVIVSYFQMYVTSGTCKFNWAYASATTTHHSGSFKIRLASKPTGFGLPAEV